MTATTVGQVTHDHVPVLLLGGPCSGVDVVARQLAAAGLDLGTDTPIADEATMVAPGIALAHTAILGDLDRDWTCPPAAHELADADLSVLADEVASRAGPWGVADHRTVHLLAAWAEVVPAVRLLAVVRDHEEVVRDLVDHAGLEAGFADELVRATTARLAEVCDRWEVPVVDTDGDLAGRLEQLASSLGLDPTQVEDVPRPPARAQGLLEDPTVAALVATGAGRAEAPVVPADALRAAAREFPPLDLAEDQGPRAHVRRRRAAAAVPASAGPVVELVSSPAGGGDRTGDAVRAVTTLVARDLAEAHAALAGRREGAVVLTDALTWSADLEGLFRVVHGCLPDGGVVAVAWSLSHARTRARRGLPAIDGDDVRAAATAGGFVDLERAGAPWEDVLAFGAVRAVAAELDTTREQLERLRSRRSVQLALRVAELFRPVVVALRAVRRRRG